MRELRPGLFHWTTFHEGIGFQVSSYYVEPAGALIDARVPDEGLEGAFGGRATPQQAIVTSGLHMRHADRFAEAYGCRVRAPAEARDRLGDDASFEAYDDGDEVAPGITAIQIGALCPDEYALHIAHGTGAISFADGLIRYGDTLGFVPDSLLGDDPQAIKAGLRDGFRGLLERDFDDLLFAHGDPLIGGGRAALREFLR
ncbi:MAG TPA: hypothetical protein VGJ32_05630 [Solirubrobacteraceae bacterium]|jgi:hypothetical protein